MSYDDFNSMGNEAVNPSPFASFENAEKRNTVLGKTFSWMFWGLGISSAAALLFSQAIFNNLELINALIPLVIIELIFVIIFSTKVSSMSAKSAKICFILYACINGLTLSTVFLRYSLGSVYITFLITASMFAIAALYGKFTQKDLTNLGSYCIMGLWGIIIAGIVNIFLRNSMLDFISSLIGIVLFIGLTAYDVNKIKEYSEQVGLDSDEQVDKVSIMGALTLYLDFINLFLRLIQFFGKSRD